MHLIQLDVDGCASREDDAVNTGGFFGGLPPPCSSVPIHRQRGHVAGREVDKSSVIADIAVPEKSREKCQRVVGEDLVDVRFLTLQRFDRAAGRQVVTSIEQRHCDFGKEVSNGR